MIFILLKLILSGLWVDNQASGIMGTISPPEAVQNMYLLTEQDTIRHFQLNDHSFQIEAHPGTYRLLIVSKSPYRNIYTEPIVVEVGRLTNIGDLVLTKATYNP